MDRKDFTKKLAALGVCPFIISSLSFPSTNDDEKTTKLIVEKEFIQNWLSDLLESMERVTDRETQIKIVEGCGVSCFNRHKFKQEIANKGKGNLDKLIDAYSQNFEIWKEEKEIHVRYGEVSKQCYCPAAKYRIQKENDIHCECTKATHRTIFETALNRPVKAEIIETLRRGGKTCHFVFTITE